MTSGTHALILAQSAFEAVCKERDEALALLASEKSTRNAIIAKGAEMEKQLEAMREAIKEVFNSFNDEPASDSAWLLDDRQTSALSKLQYLA